MNIATGCKAKPIGRVVLLVWGLGLSIVLGLMVELIFGNLLQYAEEMRRLNGGKPMPVFTQWAFDVFGTDTNGGMLSIFLIPWALLLFFSLSRHPADHSGRDLKLLYLVQCFHICEILLFLFFMFAGLQPFIPNYRTYIGSPPDAQVGAFIPQILLAVVFAAVIGRIVTRSRKAGPEEGG